MPAWADLAAAEPDLAGRVRGLFTAHRHHTMATLRRDGSPRLSGTEVRFDDADLVVAMMPRTLRALDLRRDPRVAIHSHSVDPPEDDPSAWPGEAMIAGTAVEIARTDAADHADSFRIDVTQVVVTGIGTPADHLVIESWSPEGGLRRSERR